jgi:hypothetical protein
MSHAFKKGDWAYHVPTQAYFVVQKAATNSKTGQVALLDREKTRYLAEECRSVHPHHLDTMLTIVNSILAGEEPIEWLSALEQEHKAELWQVLTIEQKAALKELREKQAVCSNP